MRLMRPLCHCLCEGCVDVSEATLRLLSPSYLATLQPAGPIKTTAEVRFKCRVRGRGVLQDGVYYKTGCTTRRGVLQDGCTTRLGVLQDGVYYKTGCTTSLVLRTRPFPFEIQIFMMFYVL